MILEFVVLNIKKGEIIMSFPSINKLQTELQTLAKGLDYNIHADQKICR